MSNYLIEFLLQILGALGMTLRKKDSTPVSGSEGFTHSNSASNESIKPKRKYVRKNHGKPTNTTYDLILHDNSQVTESYAIQAIAEVCGHSVLQALQLATLISYKGQCSVKVSNDLRLLKQLQKEFNALGLGATIEEQVTQNT